MLENCGISGARYVGPGAGPPVRIPPAPAFRPSGELKRSSDTPSIGFCLDASRLEIPATPLRSAPRPRPEITRALAGTVQGRDADPVAVWLERRRHFRFSGHQRGHQTDPGKAAHQAGPLPPHDHQPVLHAHHPQLPSVAATISRPTLVGPSPSPGSTPQDRHNCASMAPGMGANIATCVYSGLVQRRRPSPASDTSPRPQRSRADAPAAARRTDPLTRERLRLALIKSFARCSGYWARPGPVKANHLRAGGSDLTCPSKHAHLTLTFGTLRPAFPAPLLSRCRHPPRGRCSKCELPHPRRVAHAHLQAGSSACSRQMLMRIGPCSPAMLLHTLLLRESVSFVRSGCFCISLAWLGVFGNHNVRIRSAEAERTNRSETRSGFRRPRS